MIALVVFAGAVPAASAQPAGPARAGAVTYRIEVTTSDVEGAGTNGTVEVRLRGSLGSSGFVLLDSSINNFERNSVNSFNRTLSDLGTLQAAEVRFIEGDGRNAPWHLAHISVSASGRPTSKFPCHCWFSASTIHTIAAAVNPRTYTINVGTSDVEGAGTASTVEARLRGSLRSSGFMLLDSSIDNFERNSVNSFARVLSDLGTLRSVEVRFTKSGDHGPWHLAVIRVTTPGKADVLFPCHCWFNASTIRNIPAA